MKQIKVRTDSSKPFGDRKYIELLIEFLRRHSIPLEIIIVN